MTTPPNNPADTRQNIAILLYRVDDLTKALADTTSEMQCEFKDIRAALKGNGKPGIEQRTADLERQIKSLADVANRQNDLFSRHMTEHIEEQKRAEERRLETEKERRDITNKIILAVITMIVTNVGAVITALVLFKLGL